MSDCIKCGTPTEHTVVFVIDDIEGPAQCVCEPCLDEGRAGLEPWHRRFRTLLDAGVSRKRANEILCAMMNRGMR